MCLLCVADEGGTLCQELRAHFISLPFIPLHCCRHAGHSRTLASRAYKYHAHRVRSFLLLSSKSSVAFALARFPQHGAPRQADRRKTTVGGTVRQPPKPNPTEPKKEKKKGLHAALSQLSRSSLFRLGLSRPEQQRTCPTRPVATTPSHSLGRLGLLFRLRPSVAIPLL
ncbi:hypothetical protein L1887_57273 [Cichorium endivia]|nr:hypothetical protein L1887_57273 [Cichorium endivia]